MGFSFDDKVNILYDYIVGGVSMNRLMDDYYCSDSREISNVIHHYNFNKKPVPKGKKGEDNGRYRKGSAACRGVNVDWDFIADYVEAYDNGDYWSFEEYINEFASGYEEEQRRQAQQRQAQAQAEAQRRQQAQADAQRRRREAEAEAQRQRQLEQQRIAEQKQQAQRQGQYNTYINNALNYMRSGNYDMAITSLKGAKQIDYNTQVCSLLAESMAKSKNASMYASEIIAELNAFKGAGKNLADWQHIHLAEAYMAVGDKNRACDEWFFAGDMFYDREDYEEANRLYTMAREKTGYYSTNSYNAPFRIAYARVNGTENRTTDTWKFALDWYLFAVEKRCDTAIAYSNASIYARLLGKFADAEKYAQNAINSGFKERNAYLNLLLAQMGVKKYREALSTINEMDARKFDYEIWRKGKCIIEAGTNEISLAISCFKDYLKKDPAHRESLTYLAEIVKDREEAYKYAIGYLSWYHTKREQFPNEYDHMAALAYKYAKESGNESKIRDALFYNESEKKRIAEEESRKKAEVSRLMEEGRQHMNEGNYNEAVSSFKKVKDTKIYEPILCALLAECMSKSYCSSFYHKDIIANFEEYKKSGGKLDEAQHTCLAESYMATGNKNKACDEWFLAGDVFYDSENFKEADRLYTLALKETNLYSSNSKNAPFRIAYARGKSEPNVTETWKFCLKWYLVAAEKNCQTNIAYSNASSNAYNLGLYEGAKYFEDAENYAKKAIDLGFCERNAYYNLLRAQMAQKKWAEAYNTIKTMDEKSFSYELWRKGKCIIETKREDISVALQCLNSYIKEEPFHKETLLCLADYSESKLEQYEYSMTLLKNFASSKDECGFDYDYIASLALRCANSLNDEEKIVRALEYNPEEKARLEKEKRLKEEAEALRKKQEEEQRIREEKKRKDEELLMVLF